MKISKNWLEWLVFAFGCLVLTATLGYLIYDAQRLSAKPPVIELRLGKSHRVKGQYLIQVTARNTGDQTAEGVAVEVVSTRNGEEETGSIDFAFLPRRSQRKGYVSFTGDPDSGLLKARVLGYEQP
ncbi:MAG TPA: hypothetical protein VF719_01140 [Abditibacteriaceae bacterium]|jgi:uncharacterized protein (TIGR02588 family)